MFFRAILVKIMEAFLPPIFEQEYTGVYFLTKVKEHTKLVFEVGY